MHQNAIFFQYSSNINNLTFIHLNSLMQDLYMSKIKSFLFKTSNVSYSIGKCIKKRKSSFSSGKEEKYSCEDE
jgi:hypothetical protein